ncbi:uncharacterized protein LOC133285627 [Gastrolobium bilobum]|uniref:uncharacterized protein LOC133285627 n=1 Tax=Gastrolobium bilobum TaxID=150636 RepID=UPI002AB25777|nr:uncharacterized protein LOC133285627 [Gastrolobium bilobum]
MRGKKYFMAVKVDLDKAYIRLNWNFIRKGLVEIKVPDRLTDLIMTTVSSPKTNLTWNGSLSEEFQPSRGVRQGDPLSPYLFVLAMEKLSHIIETAANGGLWKPIRAGKGGPKISHILFADDLMLFLEVDEEQLHVLLRCLNLFGDISGQKSDKTLYAGIVDRMKERLTSWQAQSLSQAGNIQNVFNWRTGNSHLWKHLCKVWFKLKPRLIWDVGDGSSVNFWEDKWLDHGENLASKAIVPIPQTIIGRKVREYVDSDGSWNHRELYSLLPQNCIQSIRSLLPPYDTNGPDRLSWSLDGSGRVTIKLLYNAILNYDREDYHNNEIWSVIWKIKGPIRIIMLFWKMVHHRIPTRSLLARMNILSATCP